MYELLYAAIGLALVFDFINGFHDSANAISTVVATRVLKPWKALLLAGVANFLGPFIFGVSIAKTVQGDILDLKDASLADGQVAIVVFASALLGAIAWNLITWWKGIPSSSSHALIGGLIGAGLAAAGTGAVKFPSGEAMQQFLMLAGVCVALGALAGWAASALFRDVKRPLAVGFGAYVGFAVAGVWAVLGKAIALGGIGKTVVFIAVSPFLGFLAAYFITMVVMAAFRKARPSTVNSTFGLVQIGSSAFYSLTHGSNDGQKTVGVIAGLIAAAGHNPFGGPEFQDSGIPLAVILLAAAAIGIGTMFGGWRIVKTMATRLTHLSPYQGSAAETGGGVVLFFMAKAGIPVSTTHAISGSIMGVGATRHLGAVQWSVARTMIIAWIITIPAAGLMGALCFKVAMMVL